MVAAIVRAYEKRGAARTISRQKHIVAEGENTPPAT
jgi:phosphate starvation-inducible PhoH-like protein